MSKSQLKPLIVLVADRTLSADYRILFEGIYATSQTRRIPELAMKQFVSPPVATDAFGRARTAPLGLRRVQAALMKQLDLSADQVVCTTPEKLPMLLGPWVKAVGFSSSDPLGRGMSNTTTDHFWSGELYTRYFTRQQLQYLQQTKKQYGFKVVGGGAGAWQWKLYDDETARACLDAVHVGYFERKGAALFEAIVNDRPFEVMVETDETAVDSVCPIQEASLLGVVELSRGCGRGCRFCTMAEKQMEHLPHDIILSDLETNVAGGIRSVVSGSEDFFRYGASGLKIQFDKVHDLLTQMRQVKGLSFMQVDHANIASVAQMTDEQLQEIRRLLTWEAKSDYLWVNMGVETANGQLLAANAPDKIAPYRADDWEELVYETAGRMHRNGFFGVYSLVLGLPGETGNDIERTRKLVRYLETKNAMVYPVFYEPNRQDELDSGNGFTLERMQQSHMELYKACYEINFRQVPRLFWDNQRCGGVSWARRALMRMLGTTQIFAWRGAFKRVEKEIERYQQATERLKHVG
jgi:radical SAM superfamily enzyme YgiQ (UPF0313 family)